MRKWGLHRQWRGDDGVGIKDLSSSRLVDFSVVGGVAWGTNFFKNRFLSALRGIGLIRSQKSA